MKNNLVERYLQIVSSYLPKEKQAAVTTEIHDKIMKQLSEQPTDEEIKFVLESFGDPKKLAQNYHPRQNYLISPAVYDSYIQTLKWVVPIVIIGLGALVWIVNTVNLVNRQVVDYLEYIYAFFEGVSSGIEVGIQAAFWITLVFALADRFGATIEKEEPWTVDQLPKKQVRAKGLALSDSIAEIIFSTLFTFLIIFALLGGKFPPLVLHAERFFVVDMFSSSFLAVCIPILLFLWVMTLISCIVKIRVKKWSWPVCLVVVLNNLLSIGLLIYLVTRPAIFTKEFLQFLDENIQTRQLVEIVQPGWNSIVIVTVGIIIVTGIIESILAIYRTARATM
ncbi:MAG: hypothetical protein ACK5NA_11655 [Enterococcus sp.]